MLFARILIARVGPA